MNREVGGAVRCAVEHRNGCLHEDRFDKLTLGLWSPVNVDADDRAVLLRERSLPSCRDPLEQAPRAAGELAIAIGSNRTPERCFSRK